MGSGLLRPVHTSNKVAENGNSVARNGDTLLSFSATLFKFVASVDRPLDCSPYDNDINDILIIIIRIIIRRRMRREACIDITDGGMFFCLRRIRKHSDRDIDRQRSDM